MPENFWLYDWIDAERITDGDDVERVLNSAAGWRRLQDQAAAASSDTLVPINRTMDSMLAARAIDLSALASCTKWGCQGKLLDGLFRSVWHYFDAIVVEGPSALSLNDILTKSTEQEKYDYVKLILAGHVGTLLKIRAMGVDQLLVFRQKYIPCALHWQAHLRETGLTTLEDQAEQIVHAFEHQGRLERLEKVESGAWMFSYEHPLLGGGPLWGNLIQEDGSADPEQHPRRAVAETVFKHFAGRLVADIRTSKAYGIPLGASSHTHGPAALQSASSVRRSAPVDEASVAMSIHLPVIDGLPISEIMRIRSEESLTFDRFQLSLRAAVKERVKSTQADNPRQVAKEIEQELIEPALLEIEAKLQGAKKALQRKTQLNLGLASIATVVGIMAHVPLILPAGVALATSTVNYAKYVDDLRDIKLSSMYFLWQMNERFIR